MTYVPCYECIQRSCNCHIYCPVYRIYAIEQEVKRAERFRGYQTNDDCQAAKRRIISLNRHHGRGR